jgi:beta-lactamase regulating signal transducer with metallopeptidase domain
MNPLTDIVLKVSLILSTALGLSLTLRARSAALRHWVLSVGIVCAVAAPLLVSVAPEWHAPISAKAVGTSQSGPLTRTAGDGIETRVPPANDVHRAEAAVSAGRPTGWQLLMSAWIGGALIAIAALTLGLARLSWIRSRARRLDDGMWPTLAREIAQANGIRRPITLLHSDHRSLLFTWGFLRPIVVLPRDASEWSLERARIVLCHELAHVRRGDWVVLLAAELLRAAYWFNPLVWMIGKRLRDESERACDDEVMNQGVEGTAYATELLALARILNAERPGWVAAPAMARPSSLERRVTAMVNHHINREPVGRAPRVLILAMLFAFAVAVGGFTVAAQTFASYGGSVIDQTGNIVTGVTLTMTHKKTGQKYQVKSSDTGSFEFVGLTAGEYELETFSPGFRNPKTPLTIGSKNIQSDIRLEVGMLEETISVVDNGEPRVEGAGPTARGYRWPPEKTACETKPTGGYIAQPTKLVDARPIYPRSGGVPRPGNVVVLDARIGTDGSVVDARGIEPAVDPDLVAAAIDAVRLWKYTPTLLNCIPIEVQMKVTVRFRTE